METTTRTCIMGSKTDRPCPLPATENPDGGPPNLCWVHAFVCVLEERIGDTETALEEIRAHAHKLSQGTRDIPDVTDGGA